MAGVDANADGSGQVRAAIGLDGEALAQLGDPAKELRLDDLRQAGWTVTGPAKENDGLTWVRLAHGFASPAEANRITAQLGQPFQQVTLRRQRSFLKTMTTLTGTIDLTKGLAAFSDPALQQALGPGVDLGQVTDDNLRVRFEADLPGHDRSWAPKVGEQVRIDARAQQWNIEPIAAAGAALIFALTGLVVFAVTRR